MKKWVVLGAVAALALWAASTRPKSKGGVAGIAELADHVRLRCPGNARVRALIASEEWADMLQEDPERARVALAKLVSEVCP